VKYLTSSCCAEGVSFSAKKPIGLVRSLGDVEEVMYRSVSLAREISDDRTIVLTFALLGLALSLLAVGRGGFIDPEYLADLLLFL
jgi:hypothetical protein